MRCGGCAGPVSISRACVRAAKDGAGATSANSSSVPSGAAAASAAGTLSPVLPRSISARNDPQWHHGVETLRLPSTSLNKCRDRGGVPRTRVSARNWPPPQPLVRQLTIHGRAHLYVLALGRELPDLKRCFPQPAVFDRVVAENGALIYDPASERETVIAEPPPAAFVQRLRERNVAPLSVGRAIVATWEPHGATVLEVIRDLGLEL
jgi:hypothetical protein